MGEVMVQVDRRHVQYRPPFHVQTFRSGFCIVADAGGLNCGRFEDAPGAVFMPSPAFAEAACAALNAAPVASIIRASVRLTDSPDAITADPQGASNV